MKNKNVVDALKSAMAGLSVLIKEKAAKRELVLVAISIFTLVYYKSAEAGLLLLLSFLLLAFESVNTAIELLCDRITSDYDIAIKAIKDLSSASIFILFIAWLLLMTFIFIY